MLGRLSERPARKSLSELPKFGGLDQADLRELRTRAPAAGGAPAVVAAGPEA